jgi:peptide-methionine (S)-S-oxide reductase
MKIATAFCSLAVGALGLAACDSAQAANAVPRPEMDHALATTASRDTAVLAGGCFWGMQLVFEHVKGVLQVTAGYAGGQANTASYEQVETGATGHAESVRIVYDPSQVTYGQLLQVYFSVAHDPTELDRQGPDVGTQYRSAIFYASAAQQQVAERYIAQLTRDKVFPRPIVTQVVPLHGFYPAEAYHQDFGKKNPDNAYIMINDAPKVRHLKQAFSALYVE